jgi:hypothetical protein
MDFLVIAINTRESKKRTGNYATFMRVRVNIFAVGKQ